MNKLNRYNFLEKFKEIHGNKYNYDSVVYKNNSTKVKIECMVHGIFEQAPKEHFKGQTCAKCYHDGMKLTKDKFIEKSIKVHGNKYIYDDINYINSRTKIIIKCKLHGEFTQNPNNHLNGQGCSKCSGTHNYSNSDFIKISKEIHNDKYCYDKVVYKNANSKVIIICSKHGEFIQRASSHLQGSSCMKCVFEEKRLCTDDFIELSKKLHGKRYNYDSVNYILYNTPVKIKCQEHGFFNQKPSKHLNGYGCRKCSISKGELKISKILDNYKIKYKSQYSFNDLKYINNLFFDFAIFDESNNIKYLLEFNGEQHYKFNKLMHTDESGFEIHKKRDGIKLDYCLDNNITLHIIRYDEDIDEKMNIIFNI